MTPQISMVSARETETQQAQDNARSPSISDSRAKRSEQGCWLRVLRFYAECVCSGEKKRLEHVGGEQ
jgi:hypothetical protein